MKPIQTTFALALGTLVFAACAVPATDGESAPEETGEARQAATPTCVTIQRGGAGDVADALINPTAPSKNYGTSGSLSVGQAIGGTPRETLIKFDLSPVPAGRAIASATATLTNLIEFDARATTRAHRVSAAWSESTVTWDSHNGARLPAVEGTFPPGATTSADLTSIVQQWHSGAVPNHGLLLERDYTGGDTFASSEVPETADRPKLEVCYCPAGFSGPSCDIDASHTVDILLHCGINSPTLQTFSAAAGCQNLSINSVIQGPSYAVPHNGATVTIYEGFDCTGGSITISGQINFCFTAYSNGHGMNDNARSLIVQ